MDPRHFTPLIIAYYNCYLNQVKKKMTVGCDENEFPEECEDHWFEYILR